MKFFRRRFCRTEVCPPGPSSFGTYDSRWRYLTRWLWPSPDGISEEVRQAFETALEGLPGDEAERLRSRVRQTSGPQDLWHLRSAVFGLVARHSSEAEAQRRLAAVDRHFQTRRLASAPAPSRR